jgi:hypothetical protein
MADGSPAGPADGLTPEQEEVRRLLAEARHVDPMPDDVVDRLDQVLAGLATESGDNRVAAPAASVVSLASRRRHRAETALVAAAAVVAVGIGLGQVIGDGVGGGGGADSTAASSAQERESSADRDGAGLDARADSEYLVVTEPLPVRPEHFSSDVRRIRGGLRSLVTDQTSKSPPALSSSPSEDYACAAASSGPGALVPVRYGSRRGVLLFEPVRGDSQVVELFACGNAEALRSVTLPAP